MFERVRTSVLHIFRVPHDPDPPAGAPGSVRVFRAGRNLYKLRLLRWGIGQAGALVGIVVSLTFLNILEKEIVRARQETPPPPAAQSAVTAEPAKADVSGKRPARRKAKSPDEEMRALAKRAADWSPNWLFPVLMFVEWFGIIVYFVQIPITYAIARLDYELRWYIVTDRSLRIRSGLASVQESTMSFANIQQVVLSQGPLQRLLGLADVRVQSAGGGGDKPEYGQGDSLHTGVFHGVENAVEIRDLIQERLRAFRQAGLGDPDDPHSSSRTAAWTTATSTSSDDALAAAHELLHETRALRQALRTT